MPIAEFVSFDFPALHAALDQERRARGLSWAGVSEATRPTNGPASRRVSATTLSHILKQRSMEADGVLTALAWLGRTFEEFTQRLPPYAIGPNAASAAAHPDDCLRFDPRLIHGAIDARRAERDLSWRAVAEEIGRIEPGSLTRLARGGRLSVPRVLHIAEWLECAPETLTTPANW